MFGVTSRGSKELVTIVLYVSAQKEFSQRQTDTQEVIY